MLVLFHHSFRGLWVKIQWPVVEASREHGSGLGWEPSTGIYGKARFEAQILEVLGRNICTWVVRAC